MDILKFEGDLSKKSKSYLNWELIKMYIILSIILLLIGSSIVVTVSYYLGWSYLYLLCVPIIFCSALPFSPLVDAEYPKQIIIENNVITIKGKKILQERSIDDVKVVFDLGFCYHIIFNFPHKSPYCLCEKQLLTDGNLEEFEKIFKVKIITK